MKFPDQLSPDFRQPISQDIHSGLSGARRAVDAAEKGIGSQPGENVPLSITATELEGRGPGAPTRTLVFCMRAEGRLAGFTWSVEVGGRSELLSEPAASVDSEYDLRLKHPYGLCLDGDESAFWVADKQDSALWRISFSLDSINALPVIETWSRLAMPFTSLPCMIDHHPDHGLLVGCFAEGGRPGGILNRTCDGRWKALVPPEAGLAVTHCCWIPDRGYCFVSRGDSRFWWAERITSEARPWTLDGMRRKLPPDEGPLENLRLRYVQGLCYSRFHEAVLVADASLGAIFAIELDQRRYRLLVGRPTIVDSSMHFEQSSPRADSYLGPIRGLVEDSEGQIYILNGDRGRILRICPSGTIEDLGQAAPFSCGGRLAGTGMVVVKRPMD